MREGAVRQLFLSVIAAGTVLSLGVVTACSPTQDEGAAKPPSEVAWAWVKAPDGSFLYASDLHNSDSINSARRRCWLRDGQFDCLYVLQLGVGFSAYRYQMKQLNRGYSDNPEQPKGGYSCQFDPSMRGIVDEGIAGDRDYLDKNQTSLGGYAGDGRVWTAAYVNEFVRKNLPNHKANYFDCIQLAKAILNSSIDTVGSTVIAYDDIIG
ncbi:hypothetical protein [Novosphingobium sp.]|uniref:hypothetical protein n=1 Tax=Novosphingobium sp. TaxID=1874826 RepID=UPI00286E6B96|nr:hypothetical protein [Novosphingobium sp.]